MSPGLVAVTCKEELEQKLHWRVFNLKQLDFYDSSSLLDFQSFPTLFSSNLKINRDYLYKRTIISLENFESISIFYLFFLFGLVFIHYSETHMNWIMQKNIIIFKPLNK